MHIHCHGQHPEGISRHESVRSVSPLSRQGGRDASLMLMQEYVQLNQEGLELAASVVDIVDEGPADECCYIRHQVPERCVKHQPVDGFVERPGDAEGGDDDHAS